MSGGGAEAPDPTTSFVLGVDLDGVSADYDAGLRRVYEAERGQPPPVPHEERSWDLRGWDLGHGGFDELHRTAVVRHRMLRWLPPIEGAAEALWRLSDAGVWIRIITHRLVLNWGHALTVEDTVHWLDEQRIPYRDLCFLGQKPDVGADAYVDDAVHNVVALRAAGATAIVFDAPYNRDLPAPRARTWADVEHLVGELVAARHGSFQAQLPGVDPGAERLSRRVARPGPPVE